MRKVRLIYLIVLVVLSSCSTNTKEKKAETEGQEQVTRTADMEDLIAKADSLYQLDIYSEAAEAYSILIGMDSLNGEFYYKRAYSYAQLDEPKFLLEDYQKAASLGYRSYDSYYNLGVIYSVIKGNDSLAIFYFKKALEEKPESEEARLMLENLGVENAKNI